MLKKLFYLSWALVFAFACTSESTSNEGGSGGGTPAPMELSLLAKGKTSAEVAWTPFNSNVLDYYILYLYELDNLSTIKTQVKIAKNAPLTYYFGESTFPPNLLLSPSTNYLVKIVAFNKLDKIISTEDELSVIQFSTNNNSNIELPDPPLVVVNSITRTKAKISWSPITYPGSTISYEVTTFPSTGTPITTDKTNLELLNLTPGTLYTFKVKVIESSFGRNNTGQTSQVTVLPLLTGSLNAVVRSGDDAGKVDLSWSPSQVIGSIKSVRVVVVGSGGTESTVSHINQTSSSCSISLRTGSPCQADGIQSYNLKVYLTDDMEGAASTSVVGITMIPGSSDDCSGPP